MIVDFFWLLSSLFYLLHLFLSFSGFVSKKRTEAQVSYFKNIHSSLSFISSLPSAPSLRRWGKELVKKRSSCFQLSSFVCFFISLLLLHYLLHILLLLHVPELVRILQLLLRVPQLLRNPQVLIRVPQLLHNIPHHHHHHFVTKSSFSC